MTAFQWGHIGFDDGHLPFQVPGHQLSGTQVQASPFPACLELSDESSLWQ